LDDFGDGGRDERSLKFVSSLFISIADRWICSEAIHEFFGFTLNPILLLLFFLYDSVINDDSNGYVFFLLIVIGEIMPSKNKNCLCALLIRRKRKDINKGVEYGGIHECLREGPILVKKIGYLLL